MDDVEPDLDEVPELPEHLQNASASERRRYQEELLAHHEGMLEFARDNLKQLEEGDGTVADIERLRTGIAEAEAKTVALREHLASD